MVVRPEKGQKLRSRASAVVQSQRRTDKEVGVREQDEMFEAKVDAGKTEKEKREVFLVQRISRYNLWRDWI